LGPCLAAGPPNLVFSHMRHRTRVALLILLSAFTAALATRTYGQIAGVLWARTLGDLCLRVIPLVVGLLIVAAALLDPAFPVELRALRGPPGGLRPLETSRWVLIGCLLAAIGLFLLANGVSLLLPR